MRRGVQLKSLTPLIGGTTAPIFNTQFMEKKIFLQELCSNLEIELNERKETNQKRRVIFFSGLRPCDYFSQIKSGRLRESWFVEVIVDNDLIFRESYIPREDEDLKIVEEMMIKRVLRNIFSYGILASKQFKDILKKD